MRPSAVLTLIGLFIWFVTSFVFFAAPWAYQVVTASGVLWTVCGVYWLARYGVISFYRALPSLYRSVVRTGYRKDTQ
jgi:hypothetical protein